MTLASCGHVEHAGHVTTSTMVLPTVGLALQRDACKQHVCKEFMKEFISHPSSSTYRYNIARGEPRAGDGRVQSAEETRSAGARHNCQLFCELIGPQRAWQCTADCDPESSVQNTPLARSHRNERAVPLLNVDCAVPATPATTPQPTIGSSVIHLEISRPCTGDSSPQTGLRNCSERDGRF